MRKLEERKSQLADLDPEDISKKRYAFDVDRQILEVQGKINNMNAFYIGFLINPKLDSEKFIEKITQIMNKYVGFRLVCNNGDEFIIDDLRIQIFESNN